MKHFDIRDLSEAHDSADPGIRIVVAEDSAPDQIVIPDAHLLLSAKFKKSGSDLTLTGEDGKKVVVEGYFNLLKRPDLVVPDGGGLSAEVVERLAVSETAGQYAQVGAPAGAIAIGRVERLGGSATVQHANGTVKELQLGDTVYQGDVVETRDGSQLGISFTDGTAFNLGTNARMVLTELIYSVGGQSNGSVFNLVKGTMTFVAGQVAKSGDMKVVTPVSTMGIRGTTGQMSVSTDAFGNTISVVYSLMSDPDGSIGFFDILDNAGNVIGTLRTTDSVVQVTPAANLTVLAETLQKTPEIIQAELAVAQVLFPIFLANPANFIQTPQQQDLQPKGSTPSGSSQALTLPPQGIGDAGPTTIINETVSGTITPTPPPGAPQGSPPQEVIIIPEQTIPVEIPANLLPQIHIDSPTHLVEAAGGSPGVSTSIAPVIKSDLNIGDTVSYDVAALIADKWDNLGNGIYAKLGSYGAAALNTAGVAAATLIASGWSDVGSGTFEKLVVLHDANGNAFTETVRVSMAANTVTYALNNTKADPLAGGTATAEQFVVHVIDSQGAQNYNVATFVVEGSNDAATLTADIVHLIEGNAAADIGASGQLTVSDVDSPQTFQTQTATAGLFGKFSIDASGAWTYVADTAHNEFVDGVLYVDTFQVKSADGTVTSVTINITGTNDAASLSADVVHLTEGNAADDISASGKLINSDVDSPQTFQAQTLTAGLYGKFSIDATGAWTYLADSAHNEFADGVVYTDTFDVLSADGTSTSVTINITGSNEAPVAHGDSYSIQFGHTLHVAAPGLLANDTDSDSDALMALIESGSVSGILKLNTDGSFDFTATALGTASFSYRASDGQATSNTAVVNIDVAAGSDTMNRSTSTANEILLANATFHHVIAGSGNDTILGSINDNVLSGGAGNDVIFGGLGNDVLIGGVGNDTFAFREFSGHDIVMDFNVGDAFNHDTLDFRTLGFTSFADLLSHSSDVGGDLVIQIGAADDVTLLSVTKAMLAANASAVML